MGTVFQPLGSCLLLLLGAVTASSVQDTTRPPCEGPDRGPWVIELRDRVMSSDQMVAYAVDLYGLPLTCEVSATAEFEGLTFGALRLNFAAGVAFEVKTLPPETSIVTLRIPTGFDDEAMTRRLLRAYTANIGLRIDWTAPTVAYEGEERVHTFWDPEEGLNGSASFLFFEDTLTALRSSIAP